ncbi:methylglyoxal reductase (NADPH-dependent) gre2 [Tulasnella sp. UAMH 9824]|nr:methylglyoxal reductase (NADPH-dependent) gre2 [Tulasnella sp. UAMH 9824]
MPAVPPPAKVLVTGASGFIAAWVVKILLEKGYAVVLVRSDSKGKYLQNLFKDHGDRFSYVVVEDIAKEGAFDGAVVGVDAVQHTASPFHFKADDPKELIEPAVKGTVGVLESIKKYAPGVKRVVITSSVAAIVYDKGREGVTYDESDWNTESPKEIDEKGRNASPIHKYRASKVLAERAAWDFVEKNKESVAFDLVTVNPPMVRDTLHLAPVDGGFTVQDILDALHASGDYPDVPKGTPGAAKDTVHNVYISGKAEKAFGFKLRTMADTVPDTFAALKERGF